jgi:hypothetical protein
MALYAPYAYSAPPTLPYAPMHVPWPPSTLSQPTWDQAAFIAAMNNFTPQQQRRYGLDFRFWCFLTYVFKYEFTVSLFSISLFFYHHW